MSLPTFPISSESGALRTLNPARAQQEEPHSPIDSNSATIESRSLTPPPTYEECLRLVPMTAVQPTRYNRGPSSLLSVDSPTHVSIPLALYTLTEAPSSADPPPGWKVYLHPKGYKYFYHTTHRIITESNISNPQILSILHRAIQLLNARLGTQNLILPATSEVFLALDIDQSPPIVKYYYVDHAEKSEFWLEETSTESLGCPPVVNYNHLKYLFRLHYWTHIELFPMHYILPVEEKDELVAALIHACTDRMTSLLSTLPFSPDQCEACLNLIHNLPQPLGSKYQALAEGYRNILLAHLWSVIDRNFFMNLQLSESKSELETGMTSQFLIQHIQRLMNWMKFWLVNNRRNDRMIISSSSPFRWFSAIYV